MAASGHTPDQDTQRREVPLRRTDWVIAEGLSNKQITTKVGFTNRALQLATRVTGQRA